MVYSIFMSIILPSENLIGVLVRGKLGSPQEYGVREYGDCEYGDDDDVYGIYQVRTRWGGHVQVKMKFYTPANPQTVPQQAHRALFADAVSAWQVLNDDEKNAYDEEAEGLPLSGFNLFMKEYLV